TLQHSLYHHFTEEAVGKTSGCQNRHIASHREAEGWGRGEVENLVLRGASDPLLAHFILPFNHYFKRLAVVATVSGALNFALSLLQHDQAAGFFLVGDGVGALERRGIGTRRVLKGEHTVVADFVEQRKSLFEVGFGFAGKSDDDVGSEADVAPGGLHPGNALKVLFAVVEPLHGIEDAGGAALDGQMDVVAKGRMGVDGMHDIAAEIAGM